jgi:predicted nucleic acid-binding Zn ribbon protein
MPVYPCKCPKCFLERDIVAKVDQNIHCPKCGEEMKRLLHSQFGINMGAAGAAGYYDQNLGKYIHTNKQRKEEMERQGVSEKIGKGWR